MPGHQQYSVEGLLCKRHAGTCAKAHRAVERQPVDPAKPLKSPEYYGLRLEDRTPAQREFTH